MKRFIMLAAISLCSKMLVAQTYYYMWRGSGESGKPEWIANAALGYPFTGIQFTTDDKFRGCVSGSGHWLLWDQEDVVTSSQNVNFIYDNLKKVPHVAVGTQGTIVADRYVMTDLSSSGNIDSYFGYGRNGDVLLSCQMQKWLRLNSYNGIAFWGDGMGEVSDSPALLIANNYMETKLPFVQKGGAITHIKNTISTTMNLNATNTAAWFGTTSRHGLELGTDGTSAIYIGPGQNTFVGFDKIAADKISDALKGRYNLFVKNGVLATDFAVAPTGSWADFVFAKDFALRPLEEVEHFIDNNGHLPDVPTAENIATSGYSQHDMNRVLLQKIEELTLYVIEQKKEIENLKKQLNERK